jgi:hypothetical protein
MAAIVTMGKFTAIGMRQKVEGRDALVINTCAGNDTAERGDQTHWVWCNPTNRAVRHQYQDIEAVSVEALWQGCKLLPGQSRPDPEILTGNWRKHKGKRPQGAYAGPDQPLLTSPGQARRAIYLPAFRNLVQHWLNDPAVAELLRQLRAGDRDVFLRDHDTGRGLDRNGPLSHAWVLAVWLNTGKWPDEV